MHTQNAYWFLNNSIQNGFTIQRQTIERRTTGRQILKRRTTERQTTENWLRLEVEVFFNNTGPDSPFLGA
jgi:hypothetical protein